MVQLFLLGIIAYVGTEQSLADWMSQFLSTYHHFSPAREGAHAVGLFWGLMSIGALNSVSRHHGAFSGILCTGILGGAVTPLLVGMLGDRLGLRPASPTPVVPLGSS